MRHLNTLIELWRGHQGAQTLSPSEIDRVGKALLTLQRGLTGQRVLAGKGYMDRPETLGAYLLYYFPVSYEQIRLESESFLRETRLLSKQNLRILDIGSGPGPAAAALSDIFLEHGLEAKALDITLVDSSPKALKIAASLFARDFKDSAVHTVVKDLEKKSLGLEGKAYDLIVMSHVVNELWGERTDASERRTGFLQSVASHLAPDGVLLISEPALLETSRALLKLIPSLIDMGLGVLAPCPLALNEARKCPIFEAGTPSTLTCHAEVSWAPADPMRSLAKTAGLDRESVKMAFLALVHRPELAQGEPTLRVVSDGMLNKSGRIRFLLCDGCRRIALSAKQTDPRAHEIGFFSLIRFDKVTLTNPESRGDVKKPAMGIAETTTLHVNRFAPKAWANNSKILQTRGRKNGPHD